MKNNQTTKIIIISIISFVVIAAGAYFMMILIVSGSSPFDNSGYEISDAQKNTMIKYAENKYSEKFEFISSDAWVNGGDNGGSGKSVTLRSNIKPSVTFAVSSESKKEDLSENYTDNYLDNKKIIAFYSEADAIVKNSFGSKMDYSIGRINSDGYEFMAIFTSEINKNNLDKYENKIYTIYTAMASKHENPNLTLAYTKDIEKCKFDLSSAWPENTCFSNVAYNDQSDFFARINDWRPGQSILEFTDI